MVNLIIYCAVNAHSTDDKRHFLVPSSLINSSEPLNGQGCG